MKKASLVILLIALSCLVVAGVAYADADDGGTSTSTSVSASGVSGNVKDISTGAAIFGATVSDGSVSATTDANGNYTLSLGAGSYTLSVTKSGYLQTWQTTTVSSNTMTTVNWSLTKSYGTQTPPAKNMAFTILAWNDLGMHCDQDDYSYFCVLPPANTLHAQVFHDGDLSTGVTVKYSFPKKTDSTLHTNFWTYASNFGWNLAPNVGLTGNGLSGTMTLDSSGKGFVATAIPITPYDDDGTWDPYGAATITVTDNSGHTETANVVAPVSTEMDCINCHGSSTVTPQADILQQHDKNQGTTLYSDYLAGKPHLCSECHSDNILGEAGKSGVESLSLAMHNFHKDKMNFTTASTNTTPDCYNCHPGPSTQCLRGVMSRAGKSCHDCHGDMAALVNNTYPNSSRQPWLNEPGCSKCHDSKHAENANTLYRNSVLQNSPSSDMNNKIYCEACHNSTHAEFTTANVVYNNTVMNSSDQAIPEKFQGDNYWIWNCQVCHTDKTQQSMHK